MIFLQSLIHHSVRRKIQSLSHKSPFHTFIQSGAAYLLHHRPAPNQRLVHYTIL
uniref:Uncharacterized protein n=1 Tax=Parascaris univalens TaxID=6257 RepID=A0A914ZJ55_PARUN